MNIAKSFMFGVTLAVSIGPIALLIVSYGINYGRKTAMLSGIGAALADLGYALAGFSFSLGLAGLLQRYQEGFRLVSSLVLIALGVFLIISALREKSGSSEHPPNPVNALWSTFLLTVMNPLTILLFVAFAAQLQADTYTGIVINSLAVFAGSLVIQLCLALSGAFIGRAVRNPRLIRGLNIISGAGIIAFGIAKFF